MAITSHEHIGMAMALLRQGLALQVKDELENAPTAQADSEERAGA